jgi:hypothetical protein
MPFCYTYRNSTVNKLSKLPIAAFSSHLLGFGTLYGLFIKLITGDRRTCCKMPKPFLS